MRVIEQLKEFLVGHEYNAWLYSEEISVYVRKGYHPLNDKGEYTLDIASVEVHWKRKGIWTQFIKEVCELNPYTATYIENVYSDILRRWLQENNWKPAISISSFYKRTDNGF